MTNLGGKQEAKASLKPNNLGTPPSYLSSLDLMQKQNRNKKETLR